MSFKATLARILLLVLFLSAPASEVDTWVFCLLPVGTAQGAGFCPVEEDPVASCVDRRGQPRRVARRLCRAVRTEANLQQRAPARSRALMCRRTFTGSSYLRGSPASPRDPPCSA
ncbi:MAG: hypothetical protein RMJ43_06525 [Chloroherpetonaceae bacterium]|nr:hypothetical protein [Chthonomonadaceae bacterium]MDW8207474.1 hypothetical protein [Chloroherpetonaceae bacterium]